ncbi:unnamed protein product, partial [marine sediment metagenome]
EFSQRLMKIRADIPVILCTGFSEMITQEKAKAIGIRHYLMKPVVKSEMAKTIRCVLDKEKEKSARILVIDDDDQIREMLRQMLEREGYEVVDAPDGKVGMRLFRKQPPELVITDLIMPEKEGIETITELRGEFPEVKIIAMTGGGRIPPEVYLRVAKRLGAMRTFAKPIEREELLEAIRELLK